MCECLICHKQFKTIDPLGHHLYRIHKINNKIYYDMFFKKPGEGICPTCGKETKFLGINKGYQKHCSALCAGHNNDTLEKRRKFCLENYGYVSVCCRGCSVREQMDKDYFERTGYHNPLENPEVIETRKNNYFNKTGYYYNTQNPEVMKFSRKKITYDDNHFDSGWEIVYYIWLKDHNIDFELHPDPIWYEYNNKTHPYFPDFKINDKIIEIKSDYLYKKMLIEGTQENAKLKCIIENNCEILLFKDIKPYIKYVEDKLNIKYSKFIKQLKVSV